MKLTVSLFTVFLFLLPLIFSRPSSLPSISNYSYPINRPQFPVFSPIQYIAIVATNDIHGRVAPIDEVMNANLSIKTTGLTLLSKYLDALSAEWKDSLLWLDAGDQFQGSMESNLFGGEPLIKFFNSKQDIKKVATFGNHDFDFGFGNLSQRLSESNFDHVVSNINNLYNGKPVNFPNTYPSRIFNVGGIRVGVFGLTTQQTPYTTAQDVSGLVFEDYLNTTITESNNLRSQGADIVILVSHVGMECQTGNVAALRKLGIRYPNTTPDTNCSSTDELAMFLSNLPEGLIDGVVAGHTHDIVHHFVNGIPVVNGENLARHFHVMYIAWDRTKKKVVREKNAIEGPIPVCDMVAVNETTCFAKYMSNPPNNKTQATRFTFHGREITQDNHTAEILSEYIHTAAAFNVKNLAVIENPMLNAWESESPLGDYVCDSLLEYSNSDFCIFNPGGIRTNWNQGNLTYYSLFQSFPFDNMVTTFEVTGQELIDMMTILQAGKKGFYHTSGLRMEVCLHPHSLQNVSLVNGQSIDVNKTYVGVSNDFCVLDGGDDFHSVVNVIKLKNIKQSKNLRDVLVDDLMRKGVVNSDDEPCVNPKFPRVILGNC